jgi:peptidoglycan/LPS O-acetylase OafA/YrhL
VIRFRPDIEGLRAVAVLLVIANHLDVPGFHGGFIGVDVFFVISGYLITSLLAAEYAEEAARNHGRGSISIAHFYLRRARRILPAALLVIASVVVAANVLLNSLRVWQVKHDAVWTIFFASNINFIRQATDYFQSNLVASSPFQHYWSLAVEEQFYLVWPLLFLLVTRRHGTTIFGRPVRWRGRLVLTLATLGTLSFLWSVHDTAASPPSAYFSAFTRAWELALGGLLALSVVRMHMTPRRSAAASSAGVGLLVAGCVLIDSSSAFPGYIALLPTLGAAFLIVGGFGDTVPPANRVLATAPACFVGRISYSLYLWHWPLIVFAAALFPHQSTAIGMRVAILALTFGVSVPSFYFVERPFRKMSVSFGSERMRRSLPRRLRRTLLSGNRAMAAGVIVSAVVLGLAVATGSHLPSASATGAQGAGFVPPVAPTAASAAAHGATSRKKANGTGPASRRGARRGQGASAYAQVLRGWQAAIARGLALRSLPAALRPLQAHLDAVDAPCQNYRLGIVDHEAECTWGNPNAPHVAVVTGDSHASMWLTAVEAALNPSTWSLHPFTRSWCGWTSGQTNTGSNSDCPALQRQTLGELKRLHPDILILSQDGLASPTDMGSALRRFTRLAKHVVVLGRTPYAADFTACLRGDADITGCRSVLGSDTYAGVQTQRFVTRRFHATFVDTTWWFCFQAYKCPAVIDGAPVFIDGNHLSAELAPKLAPLLREVFRGL